MKKLLFLLPFLMFGQSIDTLVVTLSNPEGGAVQGVPQGYSKITIQTGIKNLSFDPFFTKANSKDFKITVKSNGYDIEVNIKKIEKEPGLYSNLKFNLVHPKFLEYEVDYALKPGRSYTMVVNPKNPNKVDEKLVQYFAKIDLYITEGSFPDALNEVTKADAEYPSNTDLAAYRIYIPALEASITDYEIIKNIIEFDSLNESYSIKEKLQSALIGADRRVSTTLNIFRRANNTTEMASIVQQYMRVAKSTLPEYPVIKKVADELAESADLEKDGLNKTSRITFNVSPPGMDVFVDGVQQIPARSTVSDSVEAITFTYKYKVFSKTERYPIKISIEDPNGKYAAMTYQDIEDSSQEWFVSYDTKFNVEISSLIKMKIGSASSDMTMYYYIGGGVVAVVAAVLLSGGEDPVVDKIAAPPSPKALSKYKFKGFKLNFGYSF